MKKIHILFLMFLCGFHSLAAAFDFSSCNDFSSFESKPVVALWRGTNFTQEYFPDKTAQDQYMNAHRILKPIYCAAAHKATGISYTKKLSSKDKGNLNQVIANVQALIRQLEKNEPITIDRQLFSTKRHAFQQKYSNSTAFIASIGGKVQRKYKSILEGFPAGNPLLSFTTSIKHAALYGYGMKNYDSLVVLDPDYDDTGKPRNITIGYIQGILLTDKVAKEIMPYDVVLHHGAGNIKINTNPRCNILSEHEVSLVGMVPGKSVVLTLPLKVPDFSKPYDVSVVEAFGLRKTKFTNARTIITDKQTSDDVKKECVQKVIQTIIEGTPTDDLAHDKTLSYRAKNIFEDLFEQQTVTYVKGIVNLNGRVVAYQ